MVKGLERAHMYLVPQVSASQITSPVTGVPERKQADTACDLGHCHQHHVAETSSTHDLPHGCTVCLGVWLAFFFFFPGFDGEDEVSIWDRAGLSFLPLPWPESPRAVSR